VRRHLLKVSDGLLGGLGALDHCVLLLVLMSYTDSHMHWLGKEVCHTLKSWNSLRTCDSTGASAVAFS